MEEEKVNFYGPDLPWLFVQNLTREIIEEAIKIIIFSFFTDSKIFMKTKII